MKYRLMDLLECPGCGGILSLSAESTLENKNAVNPGRFTCSFYCSRLDLKEPKVSLEECRRCLREDIIRGSISCVNCGVRYGIENGVPDFTETGLPSGKTSESEEERSTGRTYSFLWNNQEEMKKINSYHYNNMQSVIPEEIVRGRLGLELGCGFGLDTRLMSRSNPNTEIIAVDISEGVFSARDLNSAQENVHLIKSSVLRLPLRGGIFDFCYSFGVIHHTPDPERCFTQINKVLRQTGKLFLYLYEDHGGNIWKRYPIKLVAAARKVTSKLNKRFLYFLCTLASPVIFVIFTVPALFLKRFQRSRRLADLVPFNFAKGPFSLKGDLYDRFGAPVEKRFNKAGLRATLVEAGFRNIQFSSLRANSGIVAWMNK